MEADVSRYLLGPCAAPVTALAIHGGPLPERTVHALGVALAETLAVVHGQGLTFVGVSPAAVLLAADGPRLTCFGAVRAASPAGESRSGLAGLEPGSLPPEQASGGRPRPLDDVYALGATLAYVATGYTTPEWDELPAAFRAVVSRCLSRDPSHRLQPTELIDALRGDSGAEVSSPALVGPDWRSRGVSSQPSPNRRQPCSWRRPRTRPPAHRSSARYPTRTEDDPQAIGPYRPIGRLGSGGMGSVYLARTAGGRTVALTAMHARIASDSAFRTRFRLESDAARGVGKRYGAGVVDADPRAETPWLATEYVLGPPLDDGCEAVRSAARGVGTGACGGVVRCAEAVTRIRCRPFVTSSRPTS